jgi:hypothetical protein
VNSRTGDRSSPHNGDFFEGYDGYGSAAATEPWLGSRRPPRITFLVYTTAETADRDGSAAVDMKPCGSAAPAADPDGSAAM